eukprot:gnl/TRDRNA2_/TRDRNA2_174102_c1_seq2.p1 gnl/TRDRNA2_/TRDRNA2_174102_c1~~gnl/TRDRNA2_/TRDRNA2_174102_c1_seq2.p1  ORF type:complete len:241 (-),score=71.51 gnl/TRDRNA2_/TRDRNA2_174102_c1_seq2:544-1266(-)
MPLPPPDRTPVKQEIEDESLRRVAASENLDGRPRRQSQTKEEFDITASAADIKASNLVAESRARRRKSEHIRKLNAEKRASKTSAQRASQRASQDADADRPWWLMTEGARFGMPEEVKEEFLRDEHASDLEAQCASWYEKNPANCQAVKLVPDELKADMVHHFEAIHAYLSYRCSLQDRMARKELEKASGKKKKKGDKDVNDSDDEDDDEDDDVDEDDDDDDDGDDEDEEPEEASRKGRR